MQTVKKENSPFIKHIKDYVYDTRAVLGVGNFSKVYIGKNEPTNAPVAIKVIQLQSLNIPKLVQLHHSEISILRTLSHPNVIKCYDIINFQQQCYIITEICDGGDLDVIVKKQGCLTEDNAENFIKDIFEGLLYLANMNIVHRDIKIANVLISKGQAKIADFGFAVVSKQNFKDMNIGSPLYMSPEGYIDCTYGLKTDVWALGILIFQLLHGFTPYAFCKLQADLKYHLSIPFDRSKVKAGISPEIKEVIFKCLQIDERKRISMLELRQTNYFKRLYNERTIPIYRNQMMYRSNNLFVSPQGNDLNRVKSIDNLKFRSKTQENIQPSLPPTSVKLIKCSPAFQDNTKMNYLQPARTNLRFGRPISNQKISQQNNSAVRGRMRLISFDHRKKEQKYIIFTQKISFKTVVNLLHYCRCLFRYAQILISEGEDEKDIKYVSCWLILVLSEINRKINEGQIIYTGSNGEKKQQKLREVRTDYEMKYTKQLKPFISNFINKPSLEDVKVFFYLTFRKYDIKIETDFRYCIFQIGYLTILLYDSTRLLVKCQHEKDFSRFLNYKDIETALGWDHQEFDLQRFNNIKKTILT